VTTDWQLEQRLHRRHAAQLAAQADTADDGELAGGARARPEPHRLA
jgi:hypothetical protein